MPTYAYPTRSDTVLNPAVVATLNDLMQKEAVPQAYTQTVLLGLIFDAAREPGLMRPGVKLPSFRAPKRKTMGGSRAELPINFETAGNIQSFYDLDPLTTNINPGPTKCWADWAYYTCYVAQSRTEKMENSGPGKQLDLLRERQNQEMRAATRQMETDLFSTNTDVSHTSQKSFTGLRHWNSTSPSTGTVFGLDRAVYTPWRNTASTVSSFATGGLDGMQTMYYSTSGTNSNEPVDIILTTSTVHGYYIKQAQAIHRIVGSLGSIDLSTPVAKFMDIPIVHSSDVPSGTQHWLNTANMFGIVQEGSNWAEESPGKPNDVAIAYEKRFYFAGALMHSRMEKNGVITVSAA